MLRMIILFTFSWRNLNVWVIFLNYYFFIEKYKILSHMFELVLLHGEIKHVWIISYWSHYFFQKKGIGHLAYRSVLPSVDCVCSVLYTMLFHLIVSWIFIQQEVSSMKTLQTMIWHITTITEIKRLEKNLPSLPPWTN